MPGNPSGSGRGAANAAKSTRALAPEGCSSGILTEINSLSGVVEAAVNKLACRINRRKTVSVTPAMGARTVAGATTTDPRRTSAGTRASAGMGWSMGLSHSFFTVKPLPAIYASELPASGR